MLDDKQFYLFFSDFMRTFEFISVLDSGRIWFSSRITLQP